MYFNEREMKKVSVKIYYDHADNQMYTKQELCSSMGVEL